MADRGGSRRSTRNHLQLDLDARDDDGEAAVEAEVVWETKKVSRGSEAAGNDMTSPTTTIQAESANLKKYLMTGLLEAPGSASPQKRGQGVPLLRLSSFCKRRASDAASAGGKRPSKRSKVDSTPRRRSSRRARRSNDMAKLKEIIATISNGGQPAAIPEPHSGASSGSSGQAEAIPFPVLGVAEASEMTVVRSDNDDDSDGSCDPNDDGAFSDEAALDRIMSQYESGARRASSGAGKAKVPVKATAMLHGGKAHGTAPTAAPTAVAVASAAGTAGPVVSAQPPRLVRRKSSTSSAATPASDASGPAKTSAPPATLGHASRSSALLPIDGNAAAPPPESSGSGQSSGSKKKYTKQQIEQKKREAMNRKRLQNAKQLGQPADADAAAAAAAATAAADAVARASKQRAAETARMEHAEAQKLARAERTRKNKEKAMAIRLAKMAKT